MPTPVSVQLDTVASLAEELSLLATQLAEEPPLCRLAAASLRTGLEGGLGEAAAAATAWGGLAEILAEECAATARTLADAVAAYRSADAELAQAMTPGTIGGVPVPR